MTPAATAVYEFETAQSSLQQQGDQLEDQSQGPNKDEGDVSDSESSSSTSTAAGSETRDDAKSREQTPSVVEGTATAAVPGKEGGENKSEVPIKSEKGGGASPSIARVSPGGAAAASKGMINSGGGNGGNNGGSSISGTSTITEALNQSIMADAPAPAATAQIDLGAISPVIHTRAAGAAGSPSNVPSPFASSSGASPPNQNQNRGSTLL